MKKKQKNHCLQVSRDEDVDDAVKELVELVLRQLVGGRGSLLGCRKNHFSHPHTL